MVSAVIKINGTIDKILKVDKQTGKAIVLFKCEEDVNLDIKASLLMVEISRRQWRPYEALSDVLTSYFTCIGKFELRKKNDKPYVYVRSISFKKTKPKGHEARIRELNHLTDKYVQEMKSEEKRLEKVSTRREGKCWFEFIDESELQEVDINKVKMVEDIHLKSKISIFNIKELGEVKHLSPIAVRENELGEYELIAGLRPYIIGKLFSRNLKAYVTNLSREEFKEKFSLEI